MSKTKITEKAKILNLNLIFLKYSQISDDD